MRNEFNFIDSKAGLLSRTGVVGSNYHADYSPAIAYFNEKMGKKNQYDLSYIGTKDEFIHTPIFNNMLYLKTASDRFNTALIGAINEPDRDVSLNLKPKYLQLSWDKPIEEVLILPGSNLLNRIDDVFMQGFMDKGGYLKLHPVTCHLDKFTLSLNRNAIEHFYSGVDVIRHSKVVWSADSSELGLIAKYLGKQVKRIHLRNYFGTYIALYNNIDRLETWLNSSKSGLIRMTHYKEDIDAYIEHYRRHYDDLA